MSWHQSGNPVGSLVVLEHTCSLHRGTSFAQTMMIRKRASPSGTMRLALSHKSNREPEARNFAGRVYHKRVLRSSRQDRSTGGHQAVGILANAPRSGP